MRPFTPSSFVTHSLEVGTESARVAFPVAQAGSVRIINRGDEYIFIAFGDEDVEVGELNAITMLPNSAEVFGVHRHQTHVAAGALATGNLLLVSCGEGA